MVAADLDDPHREQVDQRPREEREAHPEHERDHEEQVGQRVPGQREPGGEGADDEHRHQPGYHLGGGAAEVGGPPLAEGGHRPEEVHRDLARLHTRGDLGRAPERDRPQEALPQPDIGRGLLQVVPADRRARRRDGRHEQRSADEPEGPVCDQRGEDGCAIPRVPAVATLGQLPVRAHWRDITGLTSGGVLRSDPLAPLDG